jgi:hypothetical protein
MATDIIARGMAANAKKSVTALGNKIESEKWIGTKAEWEAVDKSTIKDGTIVYITDDETVILYDKAEMEKIAAQVATDRKAAETAAQTAQSVADSLPEDYTTAVEKIAENTAEISAVKLTDKELQRRVDALYSIGQGITHQFETDTDTAYQKAVPTGAKLMSVKSVGGKSVVWNQLISQLIEAKSASVTGAKLTDKTLQISGTSTNVVFLRIVPVQTAIIGHKYLFHSHASDTAELSNFNGFYNNESETDKRFYEYGKGTIFTNADNAIEMRLRLDADVTVNFQITPQLFDLTAMFGSGNEPTTVEEFEAMFPAAYYPYNAGEIVSAGVTEVVEQGRNLFDVEKCAALGLYYGFEIDTNKTLQIALKDGKTCPTNASFGIAYTRGNTMANWLITSQGVVETKTDSSKMTDSTQIMVVCYPGNKETMQSIADAFDIMLVGGIYKPDTMPAYAPFHRNEYPIPEAIKALPGYGWSAGTARNYVDYENKRYVQCVDSVDLGTLTWEKGESVSFKTHHLAGQKLTKSYSIAPNFICPKYSTKTQNESWGKTSITGISATSNVNGYIYVNDTSYTDATAFKQAMQGVTLYYELANPIVTDISDLIPDDFLRNIEVEAGGSITFKNSNGDDYRIPVPSEEEYVVKLSEVGGTT